MKTQKEEGNETDVLNKEAEENILVWEQKKTFLYPEELPRICGEAVPAMANFFGKFCDEVIVEYDEDKKNFEDIEQEIIFNSALQYLHAVIDACPLKQRWSMSR